ncbi:MAG: glycoside hydrolase family 28 protein [Verrucomicrobiota bacterium]|nr:glycoside hydrolase family 28 protein [Verrucomicrobiota bacterium]
MAMVRRGISAFGLFAFLASLMFGQVPQRAFDVRAYGAVGDGKTLDTAAINKAIDAAAAVGGGTVCFPAGTYASYSIHLKSNVALYLDQGATILAADPPAVGQAGGYDAPEPNQWDKYEDFGHAHWHNSLIWGEDLQNVSILGPGTIFGRGLSRGFGRKEPLPSEGPSKHRDKREITPGVTGKIEPGPFGYPSAHDTLPAGVGNKAIALKNCRNVIFRDFTIFHGGHFGILAIATDNFTIDNLKIDTNRDGMDVDSCANVRISNCTVNSPFDDGICLKSCFGLGYARATENVTITNCQVSGYMEGSLLDGTYKRSPADPKETPTGRIKLGTEANGGFKNITVSNCVFDYCRGLALEEVDGGSMEDITITNLTMRDIVNAPIFVRLGLRNRGPHNPSIGAARRIKISNVVAYNVAPDHGILIAGLAGHPVEDLSLSNILIVYRGGGTEKQAKREVPEYEESEIGDYFYPKPSYYPEPSRFGIIPSYGMFVRHVKNFSVDRVELRYAEEDRRPAVILDDVAGADFDRLKARHADGVSIFVLKNVKNFTIRNSPGVPDTQRDRADDMKL